MSDKGIDDFLDALFASEGGTKYNIENKFGYIGKYQFGEDALIDTGYYLKDGSANRDAGRFRYDWIGRWSGKNGATSKAAFLSSPEIQDQAAKDWVKLLCTRLRHYKLNQYIGKVIADVAITESGIIAAAHLKGFGNPKSPGVIAFLQSGGTLDPADAYGTHVSKYMRKFSGYALGCCASCAVHVLDRKQDPISGIRLLIKAKGSEIYRGLTDSDGKTPFFGGFAPGHELTVLIERLEGGFKEITKFVARTTPTVLTLQSPKTLSEAALLPHAGAPGNHSYQRVKGQQRARSQGAYKSRPVGSQRNSQGNPVEVLAATQPLAAPTDRLNALQEILLRNAGYGAKGQSLSGPDAVKKSRRGDPISSHVKATRTSLGQCYKYVKVALQASGMVGRYLAGEHAKDAGAELAREGFLNILERTGHGIEGPMDAPIGAVIVYGTTDGSPHGHIEIRAQDQTGEQVVVSDYTSTRPRTELPDGVKRLSGRGRVVIGIWVKTS